MMMSQISQETKAVLKFYTKANKIKSHSVEWNRDVICANDEEKKIDIAIKKLNFSIANDASYFQSQFQEIISEIDAIDDHVPLHHITSPHTLLAFMWDSTSPFFHTEIDNKYPRFKQLKIALNIENSESYLVENSRSEHAYIPANVPSPFPYLSEEFYFAVPSFKHMTNRDNAHLGLIVDKVVNEEPIEINPLTQFSLEKYEADEARVTKIKQELLKRDTTWNRIKALKDAVANLLYNVMVYQDDTGIAYRHCYIFANPIMKCDGAYTRMAYKVVKLELQKAILALKNDKYYILPKIIMVMMKSDPDYKGGYFHESEISSIRAISTVRLEYPLYR